MIFILYLLVFSYFLTSDLGFAYLECSSSCAELFGTIFTSIVLELSGLLWESLFKFLSYSFKVDTLLTLLEDLSTLIYPCFINTEWNLRFGGVLTN